MDKEPLLALQEEIAELEQLLISKKQLLEEAQIVLFNQAPIPTVKPEINNNSPPKVKIAMFYSFFKGREDVYARRFESKKTGKSGYDKHHYVMFVDGEEIYYTGGV